MIIQTESQEDSTHKAYDLIILDLDMPIKNGYDCCKHIKHYYSYR